MNNHKPWYENISIWIAIIAGICTILTFVFDFFNNQSSPAIDRKTIADDNKKNNSFNIDGDKNIIIQGDNTGNINVDRDAKDTLAPYIMSQVNKTHENEKIPQFNFGKAIRHIHKNEIKIKKEIINNKENKPTYSSIYPGVCYFKISKKIRLIEVTSGFRDFKCSRLYHFDKNNKLTFSLIKDKKGEHRLYFCNDMLIRYIDINGKIHDIKFGLENFECKWTKLALEESYEIFNGV